MIRRGQAWQGSLKKLMSSMLMSAVEENVTAEIKPDKQPHLHSYKKSS